MTDPDIVAALGALAHPGRLSVFRLLIRRTPDGVAAGDIAVTTGLVPQTLSGHLAILRQTGLVRSERVGRSIRYRADVDAVGRLLAHLIADCCGGAPELCAPVGAALAAARSCGKEASVDG